MRQRRLVSLVFCVFALPWFADLGVSNAHAAQQPSAPVALSHARVVSLSMVHGLVAVRKPETGEWFHATLNAPVEEGFIIATERNSFAEVQFENGSTLRIGEFSRIEFNQLALAPHSGHVNHMTLVVGLATVNVIPEKHDEYVVTASGVHVTARGKAEFRTDLKGGRMRVEVFNGRVLAADAKETELLRKNRALAYDYRSGTAFQETKPIQRDDWDQWVKARDREADLAAYRRTDDPNNPGGGLLYGWDDLLPFGGPVPDGSSF